MHSHAERKIYRCKICPYGGQYFCQLLEHILRTHASRSNLHCLECPLGHSPYFPNTLAYLNHLSVTHHNNLARHLGNIFSEPPELPVNLEVSTTILYIISYYSQFYITTIIKMVWGSLSWNFSIVRPTSLNLWEQITLMYRNFVLYSDNWTILPTG